MAKEPMADENTRERRRKMKRIVNGGWILFVVLMISMTANAAEVKKITKEELKPMLGSPDAVVLDVRSANDWLSSDEKIAGALREDPDQVDKWMGKYSREKTLIFYCD